MYAYPHYSSLTIVVCGYSYVIKTDRLGGVQLLAGPRPEYRPHGLRRCGVLGMRLAYPVRILALRPNKIKGPVCTDPFILAGPTGFEPAISSVTGRRDNHFTTSPKLHVTVFVDA